jgi:prephenate dehydrogenase
MTASSSFGKVVIAGVGLIGGSFGLALRSANRVGELVGVGRSRAAIEEALARGAVDRAATDWADAMRGADLVLIATPVGQIDAVMGELARHLEPDTVLTDAGSTKRGVVAAAYRRLGARAGQFVPGHPIAGAERSGVAAASADLYRGRHVILAPLPENDPAAIARVRAAWEACGARVSAMSADEHDRVFAAVSHLPHLLAFALVDELAARDNADLLFGFAAGGFRDFTRIAGSHPEMWRDICMANREALIEELDRYLGELGRLRQSLCSSDAAAVERIFARARAARNAWADSSANPS